MTDNLKQFYNKLRDCKDCPLSGWKEGLMEEGWGNEGKILFLGQYPAYSSIDRRPGDSNFDKMFIELLHRAQISEDDFFFTNYIKYPPRDPLDRDDRNHITKHLMEEIGIIKPMITVSLGNLAGDWLIDSKISPMMSLPHPGSLKYGHIDENRFVQMLITLNKRYSELKGRTNQSKLF